MRETYWFMISGASEIKRFYGDTYYRKLLTMVSPWDNDIKKDIDRTFIHNKIFKSRNGYIIAFKHP